MNRNKGGFSPFRNKTLATKRSVKNSNHMLIHPYGTPCTKRNIYKVPTSYKNHSIMGPPHTICASSALFPTPSISWGLFSIPSFHFIIVEQKNGPGSDLVKKFFAKNVCRERIKYLNKKCLSLWQKYSSIISVHVDLIFFNKPEREKEGDFFIDIEAKMLSV